MGGWQVKDKDKKRSGSRGHLREPVRGRASAAEPGNVSESPGRLPGTPRSRGLWTSPGPKSLPRWFRSSCPGLAPPWEGEFEKG